MVSRSPADFSPRMLPESSSVSTQSSGRSDVRMMPGNTWTTRYSSRSPRYVNDDRVAVTTGTSTVVWYVRTTSPSGAMSSRTISRASSASIVNGVTRSGCDGHATAHGNPGFSVTRTVARYGTCVATGGVMRSASGTSSVAPVAPTGAPGMNCGATTVGMTSRPPPCCQRTRCA